MNNIGWHFKYTYKTLPGIMFSDRQPRPVKAPELIILNEALCKDLKLKAMYITPADLSGNNTQGMQPYAQAYAGHQFGHFTILGDGRAIMLGEHLVDETLYDIQFKGSGRTRYSRAGDGRASLSAMLREYIISEAMFALNIPTTRSLAVVKTGENITREKPYKGGILTRVSKGHIRVGTFQFAALDDINHVKILADYTIDRFYPDLNTSKDKYLDFLYRVIDNQAALVAKWQAVGFIHGVMNTDNTSIAGETIDYGPCAFMDEYNEKTVFSSIDNYGRYAYINQPGILQWNLARFAETLIQLLDDDQENAVKKANEALVSFTKSYDQYWLQAFRNKLGCQELSVDFIKELLSIMQVNKMDFTNTFVDLADPNYKNQILEPWLTTYRSHEIDFDLMKASNPLVIPRNHLVDQALKAAEQGDYQKLFDLVQVLQTPFDYDKDVTNFNKLPQKHERVLKTYCGT